MNCKVENGKNIEYFVNAKCFKHVNNYVLLLSGHYTFRKARKALQGCKQFTILYKIVLNAKLFKGVYIGI